MGEQGIALTGRINEIKKIMFNNNLSKLEKAVEVATIIENISTKIIENYKEFRHSVPYDLQSKIDEAYDHLVHYEHDEEFPCNNPLTFKDGDINIKIFRGNKSDLFYKEMINGSYYISINNTEDILAFVDANTPYIVLISEYTADTLCLEYINVLIDYKQGKFYREY